MVVVVVGVGRGGERRGGRGDIPLLKGKDRLVSVSKETVSTLHTLVPRQTSQVNNIGALLIKKKEYKKKCGYNHLFPYRALKLV